MKIQFLNLWYSLTFRLISFFIVLSIVGLGLYLALSLLTKDKLDSYPLPFLTYIAEEVSLLDHEESIYQLMSDTLYSLRIESADHSVLQTDPTIPSLKRMTLSEQLSDIAAYYLDSNNVQYLVIQKEGTAFIFVYRYGRHHRANIYQGLTIFIPVTTVLFLLAIYFIFFRFFKPLSWIRQGATRIGAGDLAYRIPYQRSDELGQLVKVVNQMAENLEDIFDSKRQLLLAISHELRTPLTRMKLNIALLEENNVSKRLHQDTEDMVAIVDSLLESERLQEEHQALLKTPTKLSAILNELKEQYDALSGLEISSTPQESEPTLLLDVTRIRLLINNLIQNAIKHTVAGHRDISITHYVEQRSSIIEVKDNGKGIAAEHAGHIFSAFYRADSAREQKTGGVGLGLYLCRHIALAHKGDLSLTHVGNDNKGSCFRLTLPHKT